MNEFVFQAPTKVVFGKGVENQVGQLCKEQGATKVLVHFGGQSAKKSGLLDRVYASLDEAGIPYVSLGGVKPNPRLSLVYEGIELCRKEGVDFLLPVGGGSVIDSAKAIGYGLANDFDVWDLYDHKHTATGCAPIGAVLTIAAAGSEMSDSSVITKEEGGIKRGYNSDLCRCKFAVMNPELTYTLPAYQTACGAADIMMHVMERYFVKEDTLELTDGMAEALIRTVMKNAVLALKDPEDYKARAEIMWASSLAHNGLMNCGGPKGDWACHQLEHELGGMFDVAHGAGLAAVWGSWATVRPGGQAGAFCPVCQPDLWHPHGGSKGNRPQGRGSHGGVLPLYWDAGEHPGAGCGKPDPGADRHPGKEVLLRRTDHRPV